MHNTQINKHTDEMAENSSTEKTFLDQICNKNFNAKCGPIPTDINRKF
jgi:hypothetical protein